MSHKLYREIQRPRVLSGLCVVALYVSKKEGGITMNEEWRLYCSFHDAYKRLDEIDKIVEFIDSEISIHGKSRLQQELIVIKENLLNYFKEKGD